MTTEIEALKSENARLRAANEDLAALAKAATTASGLKAMTVTFERTPEGVLRVAAAYAAPDEGAALKLIRDVAAAGTA